MRPLAILLIVSTSLCADDDPTTKAQIAATVNNQPISVRLAEYELQRSLRGRKVAPHLMKALKAETLRKLVMREVVLQHLEKSGLRVNDQQVNEAVLQWKTQLEQDGKTVQQTLKEMDVAPNDVKRGFRWQLMWGAQLKKYLTDKNLKNFFDRNKRDYDGTELRVAQILLKTPQDGDAKAIAKLVEKAKSIREELKGKESSFGDFAKKHSESPSGKNGGALGWIRRNGPMLESFNKVAFALKVGQVSEPFVSPYGVHIVYCAEEKAGKQDWTEVEVPLRRGVARYLLNYYYEKALPAAKIRYTEHWPHFEPGTNRIAPGKNDDRRTTSG